MNGKAHDTETADPVAVARSLNDLIESQADAAEKATTMTAPVVAAFKDTRLFWIMLPTELGGGNADIWTTVETIAAVSKADPSTGWAYMANAMGGGILCTRLGTSAVKEIYLAGEPGIIAGMTAPTGVG